MYSAAKKVGIMKYDLWVRPRTYQGISEVEGPTPEDAKLNPEYTYLVLGIHDNGEMSSEAYVSVVNEFGELWFVSNRHFIVEDVLRDNIPVATIKNGEYEYLVGGPDSTLDEDGLMSL